jgi:hypothetical protein
VDVDEVVALGQLFVGRVAMQESHTILNTAARDVLGGCPD